ncbi:hypothetical protein [Aeromicrobium sp.]|uniref:hypothetical protein n=1 Tax=Aeromicrobium sp. TaxID=1871063 RepID=UPI0030BE2B6A
MRRPAAAGRLTALPGTPRWAVVAAWATLVCVLPSSVWRTAVGLGVPLGWSDAHLRLERIPGFGTFYVIGLSVGSIAAAALTLGLIYRWGEEIPSVVPVVGGRRVPIWLAAGLAVLGAVAVAGLVALSITNWSQVSGFADSPTSGWAILMVAAYGPAILWAPLLLAVTYAYVLRRTG